MPCRSKVLPVFSLAFLLLAHGADAQVTGVNTPPNSDQPLFLGTNGNVTMVMDAGGYVGIGIGTAVSPTPVTVEGGTTTGGVIQINNDVQTGIPNAVKFLQTDYRPRPDLKKGCVAMGIATGGSRYGGIFFLPLGWRIAPAPAPRLAT